MPNATGIITKIWPNNGKPKIVMQGGLQASCFSAAQLAGAEEGDDVSFAYEVKNVNGKDYTNVKGNVAVVAKHSAAAPAASSSAPQAAYTAERNGMQVGAAINQAIAYHAGQDVHMQAIEDTARTLLLMGDRLSKYEVAYKASL